MIRAIIYNNLEQLLIIKLDFLYLQVPHLISLQLMIKEKIIIKINNRFIIHNKIISIIYITNNNNIFNTINNKMMILILFNMKIKIKTILLF